MGDIIGSKRVAANATEIEAADITDERDDEDVCGYALLSPDGIVLKSPNGTFYLVSIDNSGNLTSTAV